MADTATALSNLMRYAVDYSTPLLLAALGEALAERSGVLNLGVEGIMAVGSATGFVVTLHTGNPWLGVTTAGLAGLLLAAVHAFFSVTLRANQIVSGLALAIAGLGLSSMAASGYLGLTVEKLETIHLDVPLLPSWLNDHNALAYLALLLAPLLWVLSERTEWGLTVRAVGDDPTTARSVGINVAAIRYICVLAGGAGAGVAGAYLPLSVYGSWFEGITAGRGWIALGIVILGFWNPLRVLFASYFVGAVMSLPHVAPAFGLRINEYLLLAIPYLAVIAVLSVASLEAAKKRVGAPMSLGKSEY